MQMTVLDHGDGITYVLLSGRLDTPGVEELRERFTAATVGQERPAIIDLSEIEFMASQGIGLLFASSKRLVATGHKVVLLNPKELVESVLKTSKLDKILPIAHGLDESVRILRGDSGPSGVSAPVEIPQEQTRLQRSEPAPAVRPVSEGDLKLTVQNKLSELEGLSAAVGQFLDSHGVPHKAAYAVNLAIDELVVNVMRYAYVDDEAHLIDIELAIEGDQAILRIVDDGRPFDPRRGPSLDLHAENREVGGLGLVLVLEMVDQLKYRRVDERNWVEVRIRLTKEEDGNASRASGGSPTMIAD